MKIFMPADKLQQFTELCKENELLRGELDKESNEELKAKLANQIEFSDKQIAAGLAVVGYGSSK